MEHASAMMGSTARRARKISDHAVHTTAAPTANASTTSALAIWFVDYVSSCVDMVLSSTGEANFA